MKKLLLSIGSGVFLFIESILISLLITPYLLHTLSKEEYAIFHLINSFIIWFGVLRAGQNGGFKYQLSLSVHRKKYVDGLYSTLILFYSVSFAMIFLISLLVYGPVIQWLDISYSYPQGLWWMYVLLVLNFCFTGISFLFSSILAVYNREYWINGFRIVLLAFQAVFTVVLLNQDFKLVALALPICSAALLFFLGTLVMVHTLPEKPVFRLTLFSKKRLFHSFSVSRWFLLGFLAELLVHHVDILLIGKMINLDTVTSFLMSAKLYFIATGIFQMMIKTVNPQFLKLYKSNFEQYSQWAALYLKLLMAALFLTGSVIFMINEYFLKWWLGEGFFLGQQVNALLCLGFMATVMSKALRSLVLSKVALKSVKLSGMIEGLLNLCLSLALGYCFGVAGIIAATGISSLFILFTYLNGRLKLITHEKDYYRLKKKMRRLLLLAFVYGIGLTLLHVFTPVSWEMRAGLVVLSALLFGFTVRQDVAILYQRVFSLKIF